MALATADRAALGDVGPREILVVSLRLAPILEAVEAKDVVAVF